MVTKELIVRLDDYIYDECHRQHVTNYGDFAKAWLYAAMDRTIQSPDHLAIMVCGIARLCEPANTYRDGVDNLRTSHVGFTHGGSAAPVGEVRERFDRWCQFTAASIEDLALTGGSTAEAIVDPLIKSLLDIHPWVDGNGRTASILRNWMLNTLDNPQPLPYYYGAA
jgi:hypothetical protein